MPRLTVSLAVLLCAVAPAFATRAPHEGRLHAGALPDRLLDSAAPAAAKDALVISSDTEVRLDDKPCKYEDVPRDAEVTLIDLSADQKVVRKIHFRSKKK